MLQASAYPAYLVAPSMQTPSLSVIQQLSQLPLLHTIRYTTNRSIHSIYRVHYLTDAKYSAEVRPNFGRSAPSAKTSASAEHCKGMFGAPLTHTYTHTHTYIPGRRIRRFDVKQSTVSRTGRLDSSLCKAFQPHVSDNNFTTNLR